MGQEMELDLNKYAAGRSPNTVLPSQQYWASVEKRRTRGKPAVGDGYMIVKEEFKDIRFGCYRSSSCKSALSRAVGPEGNTELKRGSMYQSSEEVRTIKKMGTTERRRKIEVSRSSDTSVSGSIVDSLCSLDDVVEPYNPGGFIEISLNLDNREKTSAETLGKDSVNSRSRNDQLIIPVNDGNEFLENTTHSLHKSLSLKAKMSRTPCPSEIYQSSKDSPKVLFSPIRKMFDPFTKSKSLRSPLNYMAEAGGVGSGARNFRRNRTYQKSLLNDFSKTAQNSEVASQFANTDTLHSAIACSPVHLHGNLKLENKHGMPFFEFKLKSSGDILVAKTWKANNAFNWVYTFHSIDCRKKSNASIWGSIDRDKDSSLVGQMQVSCYLCSELKDGVFDNSMVTEFVLYDIVHARQRIELQDDMVTDLDSVEPLHVSHPRMLSENIELDNGGPQLLKDKLHQKHASNNDDCSSSHPWASAELHTDLEIAAIVLEIPFTKRESLKYKRGDKISHTAYSNLLDLCMVEKRQKNPPDKSREKVKVVIPTGNHGLPNAKSRGPSSLLDRWRSGGACDCGGWDMACPLVLLGNSCIQFSDDLPLLENYQPLELFIQGARECTPALSVTVLEEGQYAVDFHAKLSTLQAFSICVAILHSTESFADAGKEKHPQLQQCNSLKLLIDEEVQFLIEEVSAKKKIIPKTPKENLQSYVLNPPFSPIARV